MLATVFKENSISNKRKKVNFRSCTNFQEADFIQDVHQAPLHIANDFEDVNDSYWAYQSLLKEVVNTLSKQKYPKKDPVN